MNIEIWDKIHTLQKKRTDAYDKDTDMDPDEIRTNITSLANSLGYERLGSGDYRVVYGNGETVVKVAWHTTGQRENKSEYKTWNRIKDTKVRCINSDTMVPAKRYLAHIKEYDDMRSGWIMMNQVETSPNNVSTEVAADIRDTFADAGIHIDELQAYNMGQKYRDGEKVPIVFDYGDT